MRKIIIRPMKIEDLEDIIIIESRVFPDPWTYTMFAEQLDLPQLYKLVTVVLDDEVVGYGGLLKIRDEGHITNLAVRLEKQSTGIGKSIVYFLFSLALQEKINQISLEVRTTNIKAQELYRQFGFKNIAVRKNYYGYEEDAFVMTADYSDPESLSGLLAEISKTLKFKIVDQVNAAS